MVTWRSAFLLLILAATLFARKEWRGGVLQSIEMKDFETGKHHLDHRYICTVAGGGMSYVVEFEKPIKVPVHDTLKFAIEKDNLIILDADRKERSARIEKREIIGR